MNSYKSSQHKGILLDRGFYSNQGIIFILSVSEMRARWKEGKGMLRDECKLKACVHDTWQWFSTFSWAKNGRNRHSLENFLRFIIYWTLLCRSHISWNKASWIATLKTDLSTLTIELICGLAPLQVATGERSKVWARCFDIYLPCTEQAEKVFNIVQRESLLEQ